VQGLFDFSYLVLLIHLGTVQWLGAFAGKKVHWTFF
jgi:hypothetical protein